MSDEFNTTDVEYNSLDDNEGNLIQGVLARAALQYIVEQIVDDKEAVSIDFEETPGKTVTLRVHVGADDKGKVIGKRGRVAQSLRTVVRAIGSRENVNVMVDIAD